MSFTGSAPNKTYQRTDGARTGSAVNVQAKAALVNNTAVLADIRENDMAAALTTSWQVNGDNQPSANLPMNDHKFTGMSAGSARADSIRLGQVQDGGLIYAEAGGTADAITLTTTPTCTPVEGMIIGFVAEFDNTTATTVNLNASGVLALQVAGTALAGGEVQDTQFHSIGFDGTQWQLLNPCQTRAALGLATTDSPQFAAINLGAAADTTLTRVSAGVIAVEGVTILTTLTGQPLDSDLTAIAALTTTATGRSLLAAADAAAIATIAGVGTANNPQFATVELGNASDTTLSRSAAGRLAVEGKDALLKGQTDTLTTGYNATESDAGTKSSGTFTPDPALGNFQKAVNGGAHTLAPPGSTCSMVVQYTNNGSAGAITTSGFTKVSGAFTTTNGDDFMCYIARNNGFSHLNIVAMQ